MKLVCYIKEGQEQLAMLVDDTLYDLDTLHPELPSTMNMFLNYWDEYFPLTTTINESILAGKLSLNKGFSLASVQLISPVPLPASCRKIKAFEENGTSFQFTNHHNVYGPGEISCMPDHLEKLDFEIGISAVVGSLCRNITAAEADLHIGGYLVTNIIRSANPQMAGDVAISLGPWLVTPDELEPFEIETMEGHTGSTYNASVKCSINEEQMSEFNSADMKWTFAEILERCAYGTYLQPGDIIFAGVSNGGVYLNANKINQQQNPEHIDQWLQPGDNITIEIDGLGALTNIIVAEDSDFTLMAP